MGGEEVLEHVAGIEEGIDHVRTQGQFALADAVQQVLQDVGDLGEIGEAEGAGRALDRMRGAKDRVQLLIVRGVEIEVEQQRLHVVEVLLGFLEEDLVELAEVDGHADVLYALCGFGR